MLSNISRNLSRHFPIPIRYFDITFIYSRIPSIFYSIIKSSILEVEYPLLLILTRLSVSTKAYYILVIPLARSLVERFTRYRLYFFLSFYFNLLARLRSSLLISLLVLVLKVILPRSLVR